MSKIIGHTSFSIGKTEHRNDDFVFARNIFGYRALGLIGDFTSDSPKGANQALLKSLATFVDERLDTWREMLLPADRLLPLVARFINSWLPDNAPKAKTTLIAFLWDLRERRCSFISEGDSGLGVLGPRGIRYLREGDREGVRIAAGFLPRKDDFHVEQVDVDADELVFAFTDGLWENTHTVMREDVLVASLTGPNIGVIREQVARQVLSQASRDDDLSMLILKGETMTQSADASRTSADLTRHIEDKVDAEVAKALGGAARLPPTPIEEEMVRLMSDARGQYARMQQELLPQLQETIAKELKRHADELENRLMDRIEGLESALTKTREDLVRAKQAPTEAQVKQMIAREVGKIPKDRPAATPKRVPTSGSGQVQKAIKPKKQSDDFSFWPIDDKNRLLWIAGVVVVAFVIGFGIWSWLDGDEPIKRQPNPPVESIAEKTETPPVKSEETQKPVVEPPKPKPDTKVAEHVPDYTYTPAPVSDSLLTLMGTTRDAYTRDCAAIDAALSSLQRPVSLPGTEVLPLKDSPTLGEAIAIKLSASGSWINQKTISKKMIAKVWLQARVGVTIDGLPGSGTKKRFMERFSPDLARHNQLLKILHQAKPGIAALDEAAQDAFNIAAVPYQTEVANMAKALLAAPASAAYFDVAGCKAILIDGQPTALGKWVTANRDKANPEPGIPVRLLWIASRAKLGQTNGTADQAYLNAIDQFAGKSAETLYQEALDAWK